MLISCINQESQLSTFRVGRIGKRIGQLENTVEINFSFNTDLLISDDEKHLNENKQDFWK